jgi:hypothetical protein
MLHEIEKWPYFLISVSLVPYLVLSIGLGVGLWAVKKSRPPASYGNLKISDNFDDQDSWSFGQLVAMMLLIPPVLAAFEGYGGKNSLNYSS